MTQALKAIIYPVTDLVAAKKLFGLALGLSPNVDQPYYVNYAVDGIDVGLAPGGTGAGPTAYWSTADIDKSVRDLVAAGGTVMQQRKDVGGGKLVATVKDRDGNAIGLMQMPK
ncbi:MAG: VOC family protein [Gemmatimonadaceae bacterium]